MKNVIYTGKVRQSLKQGTLKYRSTGEADKYRQVLVIHELTGEELYYSEQEFNILFKII